MITSNCPRCQEPFRIPAGQLPDDAYATCPWCRETFPLSEVLASLPPALEISTADGEPLVIREQAALGIASTGNASEQSGEGFEVLEDDLNATVSNETVMSETIAEDSWNQTSFEVDEDHVDLQVEDPSDSWDKPQVAEQPAPMTVAPRPRRKKSSGLRTMIGIVVGGLLSIPIALGILLLVGREPDLGFWPFDGPGTRRTPTAAPLGPLSERPQPSNDNRGRTLDTSAFDRAMAEIEDPASSALDELIPPTLDSGDDPVRQPSGQELALSSGSPTLVDVNEEAPELKLPDLPIDQSREVPEVELNTQGDVETVGLEAPSQTVDSQSEPKTSEVPSLDLPDDIPLPTTDPEDALPDTAKVGPVGDVDTVAPEDSLTLPATTNSDETADIGAVAGNIEIASAAGDGVEEAATPALAIEESLPSTTPDPSETAAMKASSVSGPEPEIEAEPPFIEMSVEDAPNPGSLSNQEPTIPEPSATAIARVDSALSSIADLLALEKSDPDRKPQLAKTYAKIARASDLPFEDRAALPPLAKKLIESTLLDDIEYAGTQWLVYPKRPTEGIALIGRPGTSPDGEIVTLDSGKIVDLLGDVSVPTVEKVLIMGRIVDGEATVEVAHVEALP